MLINKDAIILCPKCGEVLTWDEVDIGIGTVRGNDKCGSCGWTPVPIEEIFKEMSDA